MTNEGVESDRVNLIMNLNEELSIYHSKILKVIAVGVCNAYMDSDPVKVSMITLMTTIRFTNLLLKQTIGALMHGLEGVGIMKEISYKEIMESPEFKAMRAHFERLKKEK